MDAKLLGVDRDGSFKVSYAPRSEELSAVRAYQRRLREECPGWMSAVEFDQSAKRLVLSVFRVEGAVRFALSRGIRRLAAL